MKTCSPPPAPLRFKEYLGGKKKKRRGGKKVLKNNSKHENRVQAKLTAGSQFGTDCGLERWRCTRPGAGEARPPRGRELGSAARSRAGTEGFFSLITCRPP